MFLALCLSQMGFRTKARWLRRRLRAAGLLALVAGTAFASQFDSFDRAAQVRGSDLIVIGRVLSVHSDWTADHSAIVTDAELAVDEVWKGAPTDRMSVRTFGGRVGNVALEVEGAAEFANGERVVLFLRHSGGGYAPFGMRFGKYRITGEGADSIATGSLPPATKGEQKFAVVSLPLGALRNQVTRLVKGEDQ